MGVWVEAMEGVFLRYCCSIVVDERADGEAQSLSRRGVRSGDVVLVNRRQKSVLQIGHRGEG